MVKRLAGTGALNYLGVDAITPPDAVQFDRAPTTSDNNFELMTIWLNYDSQIVYMLANKEQGVATWIMLSASGSGADSFVTDSGTATPSGGVLTVAGGSNIGTTGSGSTLTVNLDNSISVSGSVTAGTSITATAGDIVASAGNISSTLGSVSAGTTVTAGTTITAGTGITSTAGNIVASAGNINATLGSISAGTTVTAGTGLIATLGGVTTTGTNTFNSLGAGVMQTNAAGVITSNKGTDGQVLISSTASVPAWATLTAGTNISIANGSNSITINATASGSGFTWNVVAGASQTLAANNGYFANNAGTVTFSLPAVAMVGDSFIVAGMNNATGWAIAQGVGQTIRFDGASTTTGVGGSLASTATYDVVELVCNIANTDFVVVRSVGNITIV